MSRTIVQACAALLAYALIPTAFADDVKASSGGGDSARDIFYTGIYAERVTTGFDGIGAAINLNGVAGARIPTIDWIGAELAIGSTIIPGKNDNPSGGILGKVDCIGGVPNVPPGCTIPGGGGGGGGNSNAPPGSEGDFGMTTIAIQLALRSPGRFYATGKFGYRYLITTFNELDDKRSGTQWSGGLGWRWGQTLSGVEIMYTDYGAQLHGINVGIVYGFGGHY
ncbi:MAG TPA: hypothetical protein VFB36_12690 [Nevskiaceae bacterium]|nr:hypothetical protein [Nevskiaceae bacterium]